MSHDDYKKLEHSEFLHECPVCGSDAELWQYSTAFDAPTSKVVCCTSKEKFGPQDGIINEGCLLYMPPDAFYQPTIRAAVKYWNEYFSALTAIQRKNRWAKHKDKVLRNPS